MIKQSFSKNQLFSIQDYLMRQEMLPCDKVGFYTDVINSKPNSYYVVMTFLKGEKQIRIGFIARNECNNDKLKSQLCKFLDIKE